MINYPRNVVEFKSLRKDLLRGNLNKQDVKTAETYITHWQVVVGSYNLQVLVKISGKSQKDISNDLGIKPRQLNEMLSGLNGITPHKRLLANYFNVSEELFNDYRQIGKTSTNKQ
jgi:hypothetical protein